MWELVASLRISSKRTMIWSSARAKRRVRIVRDHLLVGRDRDLVKRSLGDAAVEIEAFHRMMIGIGPLASARSARWMRDNLFGVIVPDEIIERLEQAADAKAEGGRICAELMQQLNEIPGVAGVHLMAPGNFAGIPGAIEQSGLRKVRKEFA